MTDDDYAAARCMAYAGAYEALADKHYCRPCDAALAKVMDGSIPNFSLRMHEGTAAMLRPQIKTIEARRAEYNERYYRIAAQLNALPGCSVEDQLPQVTIVGDSVQFNVEADALGPDLDAGADAFLAKCAARACRSSASAQAATRGISRTGSTPRRRSAVYRSRPTSSVELLTCASRYCSRRRILRSWSRSSRSRSPRSPPASSR